MKVCRHCGAPVRDNQKICDGCGTPTGGGNQRRRNVIMSLLAVLSFTLGIGGIGFYTAHHKRMVLAEEEKERLKQREKEERAEELAAEALAEQERRENASSSSMAEPAGQDSSQPQEDPTEEIYTDLSKLAQQDLQPLVEETGAIQTENGGDYTEYHTENDAVILAYTETGYSVSLDSECIYSLYGVYVGMNLEDALSHLDSRGFRRTEDEEEICYQIDEIDLLYVFDNGSDVTGLRLDVLVGDMQEGGQEDIGEDTEDTEDEEQEP